MRNNTIRVFVICIGVVILYWGPCVHAQDTGSSDTERYRVGDHELLFAPTARTIPPGKFYVSDYELFFLNFGYAPIDNLHISAFSFFPIFADAVKESFTIGAKYRFLNIGNTQFAANTTINLKYQAYGVGGIITHSSNKWVFNANLNLLSSLNEGSQVVLNYLLGVQYYTRNNISLIGEFGGLTNQYLDEYNVNTSVVMIGGRWSTESIALEFGGFRPLAEEVNSSELIAIPYLKGTLVF